MDENLNKELKQIERRKRKAREDNDVAEEAKLCNVAGKLLAEYRLFEEAIEEHRMELRLSESINDPLSVAISHRKLGECLSKCQDFKNAIIHQKEYLKLSQKSQDLVEEQRAWATIGKTRLDNSEFLEAHSAFYESLSICDNLGGIIEDKQRSVMKAPLYLNLGLVYNGLQNQKKGIDYIEKALAIALNLNLKDTEFLCLFNLGDIKLSENCPAEALQYFDKARRVAQHQKKKFDEADALLRMGRAYLRLGDFKGAKNILKKCFKIMKHGNLVDKLRSRLIKAIKGTQMLETVEKSKLEKNYEALMRAYEDLGDLCSAVKCNSKAIHYYLRQFELSKELEKSSHEKAVICKSIALSYSADKQYEKAKEYYYLVLQFREGELLKQCDTWCNIADQMERAGESFEDIETAYENALECARKGHSLKKERKVLKLGQKYMKENVSSEVGMKIDDDEEEDDVELSDDERKADNEVEDSSDDSDNSDDVEGDRLIEEEMEISDDEEEDDKGKSKARISKRNEKGETTLHVAAIKGDYNLALASINKGVSVHSRDHCGWQPLHEACNHGNLAVAELLLDKGADVNDPGGPDCGGMTPLHDAAQNAHVDIVKMLISRGADVTNRNKDKETPLDQVLRVINDDDDDDDLQERDPESAQVQEELVKILRKASTASKRTPERFSEMRRRDKLDFADEGDVSSDTSQNFLAKRSCGKFDKISRKRKSGVCELDSDDEDIASSSSCSENFDQNKAKVAKVSKNIERELWMDERSDGALLDIRTHCGISEASAFDSQVLLSDEEESSCRTLGDGLQDNEALDNRIPGTSSTPVYVDPVTGVTLGESQSSSETAALIPESEYLKVTSDAWLVDDMPKKSGKRNRSTDIRLYRHAASSHKQSGSNVPRAAPQTPRQRSRINTSGNMRQTRLSNHVVRGRSSPVELHNTTSECPSVHVVRGRSSPVELHNTTPECPSVQTPLPSSVSNVADIIPPMRLRVMIKEKMFLIACPSSPGERRTVRWLAEQATLRYYSSNGLKPVLSLSTTEGASLSPDDLITDVLSNDEQVIASVENWDLPPLAQRYEAACIGGSMGPDKEIMHVFQHNPHVSNVQLLDMALTAAQLHPVLRALQCHEQLVRLSLSGNRMGDDGLHQFASLLPSLSNLTALGLSCNGITQKGLRYLASKLTQDEKVLQAWSSLKELDISFNTITDVGESSLATVLRSCPGLQILNLESCALAETFHQCSGVVEALMGLKGLLHLNVSYNQIKGEDMPSLLGAISCSPIETLDISSTLHHHNAAFVNSVVDYLNQKNCRVRNLQCRGCHLKDDDISKLAKTTNIRTSVCKVDWSQNNIGDNGVLELAEFMQNNSNIKHLNLSGNKRLTNDSLLHVLAQMTSLQFLDLTSCGLTSPLPTSLGNLHYSFPGNLKFLNLSNNFLEDDDIIGTLANLWNSRWQEKSQVCMSKSIVIFSVDFK